MSPEPIYQIQAELCKTMSSPTRLEIVHILREGPKRVTDIAEMTGCSQATVSRHLGVLRNGGIVTFERSGQDKVYRILNPKIVSICDLMREVLIEDASRRSRIVQSEVPED